jgi:hypothetical protein
LRPLLVPLSTIPQLSAGKVDQQGRAEMLHILGGPSLLYELAMKPVRAAPNAARTKKQPATLSVLGHRDKR